MLDWENYEINFNGVNLSLDLIKFTDSFDDNINVF